jgi:hypothetical protein
MSFKPRRSSAPSKGGSYTRRLRYESLEDRRVLSTSKADIVFLYDESTSGLEPQYRAWLTNLIPALEASFVSSNIDAKFGLIGFGDSGHFAHSHIVNTGASATDPAALFGSGTQFVAALGHLQITGGAEDGWDSIEHAIAEYDFRDGAVPIFVLMQNAQGRADLNRSLTRDGIFAALQSKNAILNSMVVGLFDEDPLFDLSPYAISATDFNHRYILGVEADAADGTADGQHDYYLADITTGNLITNLPTTSIDSLQVSFDGSNTGATGMVQSGKSILIGQNIVGGIGGSGITDYRAKNVPFTYVDMTGATIHADPSNPIAYTFNYFGNRTQLWANDNGTISFGFPFFHSPNKDLATADTFSSTPFIAAFWDDLTKITSGPFSGQLAWKLTDIDDDQQNDLVIEWRNYRYSEDLAPFDPITFQAVLYANGHVGINIKDIDSYNDESDFKQGITGGLSATIGLWPGFASSITQPAGKFVPGPHRINGSQTPEGLVPGNADTNDGYVRMAWDTRGAAWDLNVVAAGSTTNLANALRTKFVASVGNQISDAAADGRVFKEAIPVLELNVGGPAIPNTSYVSDATFVLGSTTVIQAQPGTVIDGSSNSIPNDAPLDVFKTGRTSSANELHWSFPSIGSGRYVVELFFNELEVANFEGVDRTFDVVVEGHTYLNRYNIAFDRARIITIPGNSNELDVETTHNFALDAAGVVKRFAVEVNSNGMQLDLFGQGGLPLLNGIRILKADAPLTITDVVIKGTQPGTSTPWDPSAWVSMKERIENGDQFKSIYTYGVNEIEVQLSKTVSNIVNPNGIRLVGSNDLNVPVTAQITGGNKIKLTFQTLLVDKYALYIDDDTFNETLDGEWDNPGHNGTLDVVGDDTPPIDPIIGDGAAGGDFRLHFAYLPGDYSGGGEVDGIDDLRYLQELEGCDGDGDGTIGDTGDYNVWGYFFGFSRDIFSTAESNLYDFDRINGVGQNDIDHYNTMWLRGDFDNNDAVVASDLGIWQTNYGASGGNVGRSQGDADNDHDVDGQDFLIWSQEYFHKSAWYIAPPAPPAPVTTGPLPKVTNVIISGSLSAHAPFSFDTVDGSGAQLGTVPVGLADTVSIVFSEDVNVSATSLIVVGMRTANVPGLAEFDYDSLTHTATWRFEGWALSDNYLLYLQDSITDTEGNFLDGEWTNPASVSTTNSLVSEFPSGDGDSGGAFVFVMTLLAGDMNLDARVTVADYDLFIDSLMQGGGTLFVHGDFNGSGLVTSADIAHFTANYPLNLQIPFFLADLDQDGDVDDDDLQIMSDNYGLTSASWDQGDLNDDGVIDDLDIDLAFAQFGLWFNSVA